MAQILHITTPHNSGSGDPLATAMEHQNSMNTELYTDKVDKVGGKGLSDTNFSQVEKDKLAALNILAQPQVQADWEETNPTSLAYILNKPTNITLRPITTRFVGSGQSYTISVGQIAFQVYINDAIQHLFSVGMGSDLNTFTQTDDVITLIKTVPTGARIVIYSTL